MRNLIREQLVRESLLEEYAIIIEGIDIDKQNKVVSFNSEHEKYNI